MMQRLPLLAYDLVCALGAGRDAAWSGLASGRGALVTAGSVLPETPCPVGAITDALPALPAEHADWDTRCHRLAWSCLSTLAEPIAALAERFGPERVAVVAATSASNFLELEQVYTPGEPLDYPYHDRITFGVLARLVARLAGVTGPAFTDSTACSSGANAFISAAHLLRAGICDAAIVGGAESLCQTTYAGFRSLRVVDTQPCRPFDAERKGMSLGEGAAFFLLCREALNEANGPLPYVAGLGASLDAHHMTAPDPDGAGAELAMRVALDDASLAPQDIGYVNLHGTGTPLNDASEAQAVARLLGPEMRCSSTKGFAGHLLGAASAWELAVSLLALEHGVLPPNLNLVTPDPELPIRPFQEHIKDPSLQFVMSNSFGFGGNDTAVVLGREA